MNDFSHDKRSARCRVYSKSGYFLLYHVTQSLRKNLPLILSHPLNKSMHGVSLNPGTSPLKGSIIIYAINEFKDINIRLRNDSVADNIYVQQNTMSSHL